MKSFKTELNLNNKQKTTFEKHAGTGRIAYNWAVNLIDLTYRWDINLSAVDLHKVWVATFKKDNDWVKEISKCTPQQAFRDLESGLKKFWKYKKENKGKKLPIEKIYKKRVLLKVGKKYMFKKEWQGKEIPLVFHLKFPNFKKKNVSDGFFLETNTTIQIDKKQIKLPKIGWVKTHEELLDPISKSISITKQCGKWFVSYRVERQKIEYKKKVEKVGVDVGIKTLATLSNGETFASPKRYKKSQKRLSRLQRKLDRQYKAYEKRVETDPKKESKEISKNYQKTKLKIQKEHYKIGCIRKDSLHNLTSYLAKNHSKVVIEDLNVAEMMKNHDLAGAIANGAFYEFKRQLSYKCAWYGSELIIADRFFASSKTCCCCGHKQDMPLKKRIFDCEKCDNIMDRDLNAAINLMNYAVSSTVKACGDTKLHSERKVGVDEAGFKHQSVNI